MPRPALRILALLALATAAASCGGPGEPVAEEAGETRAATATKAGTAGQALFSDRAAEAGIDFFHFNGMVGEYYFPEMNGSGAAFFDYDNDGDLDAYLVQGNFIDEGREPRDAIFPPTRPLPEKDRLYRNDLEITPDGVRRLRFTDVTDESGIVSTGYGMGVTAGDYDNDGWIDLYVTNLRSNNLFRNRGDGTFEDVTLRAGVDDRRWSIAALFFDYDRDGWLDLYVGNYVDFNLGNHRICKTDLGGPDWCGPLSWRPEPDTLFRNRGDGTFEDVTSRAGLGEEFGNGMGATVGDFNGDGWIDLYVANDGVPNQMWINQGDGTFLNDALLSGTAVNEDGQPEASMGIDVADFDGDGDEDLFMTHLAMETNTVYLNDGQGYFEDVSVETGLAMPSWENTGFGTSWIDYDNDGLLDIMVVNGAVRKVEELVRRNHPYPLAQPNQLYHNVGGGTFEEVSDLAGPSFRLLEVSRGVAFGDVDNDGDADALVNTNAGPARLFINNVGQDSRWIGLRVMRADTRADALGARVEIRLEDGSSIWARVKTAGSYASSRDPRVLAGLGKRPAATAVRVFWPQGGEEWFTDIEEGRYNELIQGKGEASP